MYQVEARKVQLVSSPLSHHIQSAYQQVGEVCYNIDAIIYHYLQCIHLPRAEVKIHQLRPLKATELGD